MKAGKLKESVLKRSILKQLHKRNDKVLTGPSVGCDYGAIDVAEDEVVVLSTDPIPASAVGQGRAAIYAATNDVAASGAIPQGVSVSLLLPTSFNEEELRDIVKDMEAACEKCMVDIIGGHTEVTRAVKSLLVTVTAVGTASKEALVDNRNLRPGMDIVVSKWVGLEGTTILAKEKTEVKVCVRGPIKIDLELATKCKGGLLLLATEGNFSFKFYFFCHNFLMLEIKVIIRNLRFY